MSTMMIEPISSRQSEMKKRTEAPCIMSGIQKNRPETQTNAEVLLGQILRNDDSLSETLQI